jgi:hypothetical protein
MSRRRTGSRRRERRESPSRKRGLIDSVPEVEWLKGDKPDFDFLDFEEAERLVTLLRGVRGQP